MYFLKDKHPTQLTTLITKNRQDSSPPQNHQSMQSYSVESCSEEKHNILNEGVENIKKIFQNRLSFLTESWTINVILIILGFVLLGRTSEAYLLHEDISQAYLRQRLIFSIKMTMVYTLGWMIVITIFETYGNDCMLLLKGSNREPFKRLFLFAVKIGLFYAINLWLPTNFYTNKLMSFLLLYIFMSQDYVRKAIVFNFHSIWDKKMHFVCNFTMNQATSLAFLLTPLFQVAIPQLAGFASIFPTLCRFTQCFVVGTHEQYLNSIKFTLNLLGFSFLVVQMPNESFFWRILASFYSFYWDLFRDWKWKQRFVERKDYRMDLPTGYFYFALFYDIFGRSIWMFFPMGYEIRGYIESTRRLVWNLMRLERQQVYYFHKPKKNTVKDLFAN